MNLKEEKDPADLIKKDAGLWGKLLDGAVHVIEFYLDSLEKKCGNDKRRFIASAKNVIFPRLGFIASEMERSFWIKKIAKAAEIREEAIWEEFRQMNKGRGDARAAPRLDLGTDKQNRITSFEKRIMGLLFSALSKEPLKEGLLKAVNRNFHLFSEKYQPVLAFLFQNKNGKIKKEPEEILSCKTLALEVDLMYDSEELEIESEAQNLINDLKREKIKEKLRLLASEIKKLGETDKTLPKKIKEFDRLSKEL